MNLDFIKLERKILLGSNSLQGKCVQVILPVYKFSFPLALL